MLFKFSKLINLLIPRFYMGGGGGPSSSTVTQSNLPEYLRPYVMGMMGQATQSLFNTQKTGEKDESGNDIYTVGKPLEFQPFSQNRYDYIAGFNPSQRQAANWIDYLGGTGGQNQLYDAYSRAGNLVGTAAEGVQNIAARNLPGYANDAATYGRLAKDLAVGQGQDLYNLQRGYGQSAADLAFPSIGAGNAGYLSGTEVANQVGARAGNLQDLATQYGAGAAGLAPTAGNYADIASQAGKTAQTTAAKEGSLYGQSGASYGASAAGLAPQAQDYGQTAAQYGQMGLGAQALGQDVGGEARGLARQTAGVGGLYQNLATNPANFQQYMSPYMQNVVNLQQQSAMRQADIATQQRNALAARSGAFGGARQAIEQSEADRALQTQLNNIQAQGMQNAYQQAQQNIGQRAQLELQGLTGAQQGMNTALQGGQLGLAGIGQAMAGQQAGLQGLGQAGQMYGLGMQGAGLGLQGLQQQLAGTGQNIAAQQAALQGIGQQGQMYGLGMQGVNTANQALQQQLAAGNLGLQSAGMRLQGLGQAGQMYGMGMQGGTAANQALQSQLSGYDRVLQGLGLGMQGMQQNLGAYGMLAQLGEQGANLTGQRLQQQLGLAGAQFGIGEQQRQLDQQAINQAVQNWAATQETPFQRLAAFNALMRGYAVPGQTTTQYMAPPSLTSQLAGAGLGIYGLSNMAGPSLSGGKGARAGGRIREGDGVDTLALNHALAGE